MNHQPKIYTLLTNVRVVLWVSIVLLSLSSCASLRPVKILSEDQLSARFKATLPQGGGQVSGQLRLWKDQGLRISFTAPIVGAEVVRLWLTSDSILVLDRRHKTYTCQTPAVFAHAFGVEEPDVYRLEVVQAYILQNRKKKKTRMTAAQLGCPIMKDTRVELTHITTKPYSLVETKPSKKYKQLPLRAFIEQLDD
ncbi:MAG TPA: DUF4292 domain-containing protein [Bacteroidaceae bacterium]|mgnify:CR=1 FL=1|nr:DUF4292 domain-containing protein [Bacteroidaceae bacterium]